MTTYPTLYLTYGNKTLSKITFSGTTPTIQTTADIGTSTQLMGVSHSSHSPYFTYMSDYSVATKSLFVMKEVDGVLTHDTASSSPISLTGLTGCIEINGICVTDNFMYVCYTVNATTIPSYGGTRVAKYPIIINTTTNTMSLGTVIADWYSSQNTASIIYKNMFIKFHKQTNRFILGQINHEVTLLNVNTVLYILEDRETSGYPKGSSARFSIYIYDIVFAGNIRIFPNNIVIQGPSYIFYALVRTHTVNNLSTATNYKIYSYRIFANTFAQFKSLDWNVPNNITCTPFADLINTTSHINRMQGIVFDDANNKLLISNAFYTDGSGNYGIHVADMDPVTMDIIGSITTFIPLQTTPPINLDIVNIPSITYPSLYLSYGNKKISDISFTNTTPTITTTSDIGTSTTLSSIAIAPYLLYSVDYTNSAWSIFNIKLSGGQLIQSSDPIALTGLTGCIEINDILIVDNKLYVCYIVNSTEIPSYGGSRIAKYTIATLNKIPILTLVAKNWTSYSNTVSTKYKHINIKYNANFNRFTTSYYTYNNSDINAYINIITDNGTSGSSSTSIALNRTYVFDIVSSSVLYNDKTTSVLYVLARNHTSGNITETNNTYRILTLPYTSTAFQTTKDLTGYVVPSTLSYPTLSSIVNTIGHINRGQGIVYDGINNKLLISTIYYKDANEKYGMFVANLSAINGLTMHDISTFIPFNTTPPVDLEYKAVNLIETYPTLYATYGNKQISKITFNEVTPTVVTTPDIATQNDPVVSSTQLTSIAQSQYLIHTADYTSSARTLFNLKEVGGVLTNIVSEGVDYTQMLMSDLSACIDIYDVYVNNNDLFVCYASSSGTYGFGKIAKYTISVNLENASWTLTLVNNSWYSVTNTATVKYRFQRIKYHAPTNIYIVARISVNHASGVVSGMTSKLQLLNSSGVLIVTENDGIYMTYVYDIAIANTQINNFYYLYYLARNNITANANIYTIYMNVFSAISIGESASASFGTIGTNIIMSSDLTMPTVKTITETNGHINRVQGMKYDSTNNLLLITNAFFKDTTNIYGSANMYGISALQIDPLTGYLLQNGTNNGTTTISPIIYIPLGATPIIDVIPAIIQPICFLKGTTILTERGEEKIENLIKGDSVTDINGQERIIKTIIIQNIFKTQEMMLFKKDIFKKNSPNKDLYSTLAHKIKLNNKVDYAQNIENGEKINIFVEKIYNIWLEDGYNYIYANNVICETYEAEYHKQFTKIGYEFK